MHGAMALVAEKLTDRLPTAGTHRQRPPKELF